MDKQELKDYLKNNLTLDFAVEPDIYQINPDQITIYLKLEGEVIDQIVMYDLTGN